MRQKRCAYIEKTPEPVSTGFSRPHDTITERFERRDAWAKVQQQKAPKPVAPAPEGSEAARLRRFLRRLCPCGVRRDTCRLHGPEFFCPCNRVRRFCKHCNGEGLCKHKLNKHTCGICQPRVLRKDSMKKLGKLK